MADQASQTFVPSLLCCHFCLALAGSASASGDPGRGRPWERRQPDSAHFSVFVTVSNYCSGFRGCGSASPRKPGEQLLFGLVNRLQSLAGSPQPDPGRDAVAVSQHPGDAGWMCFADSQVVSEVLLLSQADLARVREEACGLGKKAACSELRQDWH